MWWAHHSQRRAEPAPTPRPGSPTSPIPTIAGTPPAGWLPSQPLQRLPPPWPTCPSALPGSQDAASERNTDRKEATCPRPLGGRAPAFPPTGARSLRRPGSQDPHRTPPPSPGVRPRPGSQDTGGPGAARTERLTTCPAPHGPRPMAGRSRRPGGSMPHFLPSNRPTWSRLRAWPQRLRQRPAPPEAAGPAVRQQWVRG